MIVAADSPATANPLRRGQRIHAFCAVTLPLNASLSTDCTFFSSKLTALGTQPESSEGTTTVLV